MNAHKVVRGFSVLVIVLAGFVMWTPKISQASDMRASSCLGLLRQELQTVLPSGWSEAQACNKIQAIGIAVPSDVVATTSNVASDFCLKTLYQDLGTVLPGGMANAEVCSTLQTVQIAQQLIIPNSGGQTACWHDAGTSTCQR
jgi:hypothetical protein